SPGLVGTVIGAESRPHAAVVDLHVQPLRIVHSGTHRANHFAGGILAMLACHGLKISTSCFSVFVIIDTYPMHGPAPRHLFLADYRDVVLCLTGCHTGIATNARVQVYGHAPGVAAIFPLRIQRRLVQVLLHPFVHANMFDNGSFVVVMFSLDTRKGVPLACHGHEDATRSLRHLWTHLLQRKGLKRDTLKGLPTPTPAIPQWKADTVLRVSWQPIDWRVKSLALFFILQNHHVP